MQAQLDITRMEMNVSTFNDEDLLALIAGRDETAFATLLDRHLDNVRALAWRVLASQTDVDDIAQDVFLKLWKNPHGFTPGKAKFSTWLYRVTLNACIDRQRKASASKEIPMPTALDETIADNTPTPEQQAVNSSRAKRVAKAIDRLPERQRHAIALSHFQELNNIETAEIMNTSVEAVESLLGRARSSLKAALKTDIAELLGR